MSDLISRSTFTERIEKQPTVFDVNEVLSELERKRLEIKDKILNSCDESFADMMRGKLSQIADDIELIKKYISVTAEQSEME